ncbi:uncharacterized protein LOC110751480 [Prunus avium]|uniref:Uncharacterized protein LOC110751480 n=1 Tax=Prunus avium TaxID=42229 RepID=A0A6P5S2J6_PRUAV|nr:uncharacterized protein LOC110751480 [Prunus avium]
MHRSVIKSKEQEDHVGDLRKAFIRMRKHQLKMNPKKCAFGVQAGNFLGFLVHQRGIEVDKNKAKAIIDAPAPRSKKELQSLLGKINFLRRFIANSAGKVQPFSSLLRIKDKDPFLWGLIQQEAFDQIKQYLSNPPVLTPPRKGVPLKLYIYASDNSIGSLLAQDNVEGKEQTVFYLSRILQEVETRYSAIEKLCLALYFTAVKLRHYMLPFTVHIIAKTDLIKYMLNRPVLRGRLGKWILALSEFSFRYIPQKAVKGQAIADFLAAHPCVEIEDLSTMEIANLGFPLDQRIPKLKIKNVFGKLPGQRGQILIPIKTVQIKPWKLFFDGSRSESTAGAGIVIEDPFGAKFAYSFQLDFDSTNNRAEYEALIIGLEMVLELGVTHLEVFGDSQLIIKQLTNEYKCRDPTMAAYYVAARNLSSMFKDISVKYIPRNDNLAANEMAQIASGIQIQEHQSERTIKVQKRSLPSILTRGMNLEINTNEVQAGDWRKPLIDYLTNPSPRVSRKTKYHATKFLVMNGDLFRRTKEGILLRCLGPKESMRVMGEIHEGSCGAHQSGKKMRWLIQRYGYFWPTMEKDCFNYAKGCEDCQRNGPIQHLPAVPLNPIVKPRPFRGWAMDFVGKIVPSSSNEHTFIIVATDYFTKWVEASAVKSISSSVVIIFVKQHIIHRFGIPETITTDRGTSFISKEIQDFSDAYGIKFVQSSPYFPRANGQAESTNKVLINIEDLDARLPLDWTDFWLRKMRGSMSLLHIKNPTVECQKP